MKWHENKNYYNQWAHYSGITIRNLNKYFMIDDTIEI